jgi:cobalt/nickel transport system permease protein
LSGVLRVPLGQFLDVMIVVHLLIGLCEGAITFAVIAYLRRVRPELMGIEPADVPAAAGPPGHGVVAVSLVVTALLLAGVVSWFASPWPDGLEWSCVGHRYTAAEKAVQNDSSVVAAIGRWQQRWSLMSDYTRREAPLGRLPAEAKGPSASAWPAPDGWRSLAGILGTLVTLSVLYGVSRWMQRT